MKKRFVITVLCMFFAALCAFAESTPSLSFDGARYYLLYSAKSPEHNGYYNHYFKKGEYEDDWTEMISIYHFPNVFSPIDQAYNYREYLGECNCPSFLSIDEDKNTGIIDFILIDSSALPVKLEFNIFKCEKSPECGTIAIQYAKQYLVSDEKQVENVKKQFENFRPKAIRKVMSYKMPEIVKEDLGDIKLNDLP